MLGDINDGRILPKVSIIISSSQQGTQTSQSLVQITNSFPIDFLVMQLPTLLAAVAALLPFVAANDRIPGSMFRNDPHRAAMAAVPMWHFGRPRSMKPCYPEDAVQSDGSQTNGNGAEYQTNIGKGCKDPGDWHGQNTQGSPFPTYYTVTRCGDSWRVTYYLYFKHVSYFLLPQRIGSKTDI